MKRVIVTGASSGIGLEIAKTFAQQNWQVLALARNRERLQQLASQFHNIQPLVCDLTNAAQVQALHAPLAKYKIHALVNNAGIFLQQNSYPDQDSLWDQYYQANLMSAVRLTRLCWEPLKNTKGVILNISSTLGLRPILNTAAYSALKAAMNNWTQSLALEGAPFGIRANALCPGIVDTPIHSYVHSTKAEDQETYQMLQNAQPLGRTGKPQDIAFLSYQFCQQEAAWTTGAVFNVDGGILLNS